MKRVKANVRIKRAMLNNERVVLVRVINANAEGRGYRWATGMTSVATFNALDRLEAKGLIRYRKWIRGMKNYDKSGYWLVKSA